MKDSPLSSYEKTYGPDPTVIITLNDLARPYKVQECYQKAEVCLKRAISIYHQMHTYDESVFGIYFPCIPVLSLKMLQCLYHDSVHT